MTTVSLKVNVTKLGSVKTMMVRASFLFPLPPHFSFFSAPGKMGCEMKYLSSFFFCDFFELFFSSFLSLLFFKMRSLLTVPGKHDRPGGLQGNSWQAGRGVCWRKRSRTFLPRPRQVARPWSHAGLLWPQDWSKLFTWVENKERKKRKGGTDGLKPLLCVDLEYWNCFDSFRINHRN